MAATTTTPKVYKTDMCKIATPQIRALKINSINTWLGTPTEENKRLQYCVDHGFNEAQFYGLYSVFGISAKEAQLATFLNKARNVYGINRLTAIMGSGTAGFQLVLNYNASVGPDSRFNIFNKECEFWNHPAPGTETWNDWINSIIWLRPQLVAGQEISAYIQNYATPVWGNAEAIEMCRYIDTLECTNYVTTVSELQVRQRIINYLAFGAQTVNTIQMIQPLFSAEPAFMGPYLQLNGIANTEATWRSQYLADNYSMKSRIRLRGFCYFDYNRMAIYVP
jgi:hypothetical protein